MKIITIWFGSPGKFFQMKIYTSEEQDIVTKRERKKIHKVFVNNLQILPVWQILFLFLFASFETHKLFLFLFVQMLALQNYSYSYLQEKYLFAEHWNTIAQQTSQNTFSSKVETYKSEGQKASFLFF